MDAGAFTAASLRAVMRAGAPAINCRYTIDTAKPEKSAKAQKTRVRVGQSALFGVR
jgi:hypothetical protein